MAVTKVGAIKIAAKRIGFSVEQYKSNIQIGLLWCTGCRDWHEKDKFNNDRCRYSGKAQSCRKYLNEKARARYIPIPLNKQKRKGPSPDLERSGDKKQARHRVNVLVRTGKIPRPNDLPCSDCGHVYKSGDKRHEYDHHEGYAAGKHTVVIVRCSTCHHKKHPMDYSKRKTKCKKPI